jgi:hypothetical protein
MEPETADRKWHFGDIQTSSGLSSSQVTEPILFEQSPFSKRFLVTFTRLREHTLE